MAEQAKHKEEIQQRISTVEDDIHEDHAHIRSLKKTVQQMAEKLNSLKIAPGGTILES